MDDSNITMEEYIRLEEEKAQKRRKVFNWETAKYGKIWYDKDVHDLISVETEFPAIVFNDNLTSNETLFCEPTISSLNNNEIDFRISFDESDDEDYTILRIDFSTEPTLCPQHIDEFDLKDETSLSEYDEVEQNVLYFNDLFPFNIIYPDDLKSDKDNDDNEIDMIQSSGGNENTQGLNNLLEGSHDKINKVFIMKSFVMELNVNIVAWNYLVNGMLFNLIKNLYVPFGIPFDPKRYFKDGNCTRMLRRPRFEGLQYIEVDIADFEMSLAKIYRREVHRVQVFDFGGLPDLMAEGLSSRMLMEHRDSQGQSVFTSRAWRPLFDIRGLLVHELILEFFSTFRFGEAMLDLDMTASFGLYWVESARQIPDKGDLSAYWIGISSVGDFLGTPPLIKDLILRLCHRLIACSIAGRSQAPKKVTMVDLFYLRGMDVGSVNIPYLLARYLRLFASGRKQGAMISGGQFVALLAKHFGLLTKERLLGLTVIVQDLPVIDMAKLVRLKICVELDDTWAWVASRPERQPDATAGAFEAAEDAPVADEGALAIPEPVQATQPLPPVAGSAQTMA
ncbi:hypothetical protein Tco_1367853 [Tanacetum coccineum]